MQESDSGDKQWHMFLLGGIWYLSHDDADTAKAAIRTDDNSLGVHQPGGSTDGSLSMATAAGTFVPPNMTTAERDALSPRNGSIIYNTTTGTLQGYTASSWSNL